MRQLPVKTSVLTCVIQPANHVIRSTSPRDIYMYSPHRFSDRVYDRPNVVLFPKFHYNCTCCQLLTDLSGTHAACTARRTNHLDMSR